MKYFCLSVVALFLSLSSFGIGSIIGSGKICQGSKDTLYDATPAGTWSSGAPLIASIGSSTGIVTGLYPGVAAITYTAGTARAYLTVTVNATAPVTGSAPVCAGSTITLSDALFGGTWSSGNTTLATVTPTISNVTVNALVAGYVMITYTMPSGCTSSAGVNINPLPAPIVGPSSVCLYEKVGLTDATLNGVWSSSLPAIATIGLTSGIVTGQAVGMVNITYTPLSGCSRITSMSVNPLPAPITGVLHTASGNSVTLSDATPGGAWSSNYPAYGSVDPTGGTVTGFKSGVIDIFYTLAGTGCRVGTSFVINPYPDSAAAFPVMGWYPFCGDFTDHSTQTPPRNLALIAPSPPTVFTLPTLTTDRFGTPNCAYDFNKVGNKDGLQYGPFFTTATPTGEFTYACWAQYDTLSLQAGVIAYNGTPALNGFGFIVDGGTPATPGKSVSVLFGGVAVFLTQNPYAPPFDVGVVGAGLGKPGWVHLVLQKKIISATPNYFFYINNILVGTFNNKTYNPPTGSFMVGIDKTGSGSLPFKGQIDDISVFNALITPMQRTELYQFNPDPTAFSLGNDTTICGDFLTLAPNPQVPARNYRWSTNDTLDTTIIVNPQPGITNTYSLQISQPYGCTSVNSINVLKTPLPVNLGVDTNICSGDTIILRATYPFSTYSWNTGQTSDTIKAYATGNYWVTVDSGVCVGHDTIFVHARVTPLVDLGPDIFNCTGSPATIHNIYTAYDSGFVYLWSNGSNLDSLVTTTSGSFWVQVTNNGCIRADSINALIVYDTFSFYSHDTAICQGRFVSGSASYNPIVSYQWTPTTGVPLSTLPAPVITPDTSARYYLTGSYPGCPDVQYSFYIDVQPYPLVHVGLNRHVCQFDTLHLTAEVKPTWYNKYLYHWSPGTFLDDSTMQNVIFHAGDTTDMKVFVSTPAGCTGSDSLLILVHPGNFDSLFADIHVCPGDSVKLIPNLYYVDTDVVATYLWRPGKYVSDSTANTPWLKAITSESFTTIGTSQWGCRDTFRFDVYVNPGAVIYLGDSVTLHPGETHHVTPETNCNTFRWFPPIGIDDTTSSNPVLSPGTDTKYTVRAWTEAGCSVVDSINVRIDPTTLISVPNAFTPGADLNNILYIIRRGIATLKHFTIYDRWGVKVFETTNISEGWNGKFNGKPQPFAVYVYDVEAVTNDGKTFHKTGNVTLIR